MKEEELVDGAEKLFVPKRGDRVRVVAVDENDPSPARLVGDEVTVDAAYDRGGGWIRLDAVQPPRGNSSGCWYRVELVAPAIAEKDRLHEAGCVFCGAGDIRVFESSMHGQCRYCVPCGGRQGTPYYEVDDFDAEITRRRQLAANTQPSATPITQPPAIDWTKTCCECGNLRTAHLAGCSRSKSVAKPDPYAVHNAKLSDARAAAAMTIRDTLDRDKQRQAFRELDRGIAGKRYPYADSSLVFSSASWESD